jgi:hypothetical protein
MTKALLGGASLEKPRTMDTPPPEVDSCASLVLRGTGGSNPSCSSGESANYRFPEHEELLAQQLHLLRQIAQPVRGSPRHLLARTNMRSIICSRLPRGVAGHAPERGSLYANHDRHSTISLTCRPRDLVGRFPTLLSRGFDLGRRGDPALARCLRRGAPPADEARAAHLARA